MNSNVTKDRWSISMDMTIVLGRHQFSLQAIIDNQGPSMFFWSLCYLYQMLQKTCNDSKITEYEMIDTKNSCLYCICSIV